MKYCNSPLNRSRYQTREVTIGNVKVGGSNPIRLQSMTTTDTMDTVGSIEQSIRMIDAGCEIVRLTAPSKKEAENLKYIKEGLVERGYSAPLVADIHFTPNAAEVAADHVEKVRVNPGNYADKKKFEEHDYTDESYEFELHRIEEKFTPLVLKCKELGRAMRIGTNHGSLSDRILSRYGDTPEGMVESAMEFLRICIKNDYWDIVISMKASNALVMVEAYRLLVATMMKEGMNFPLHLGVTEAGDGEDGRIKSAVGIGTLLEDGIGDTIRVSLTEEPEAEIPVAQKLVEKFDQTSNMILPEEELPYDPFDYHRRETTAVLNIGDHNHPVVFGDLSFVDEIKPSHFFGLGYSYSVPLDKWNISDQAADCVYIGKNTLSFEVPEGVSILCDHDVWVNNYSTKKGYFPLVESEKELSDLGSEQISFLKISAMTEDLWFLKNFPNTVLVCQTDGANKTQQFRYFYLNIAKSHIHNPIILVDELRTKDDEKAMLWTSSTVGACFIDGLGDGLWLKLDQPTQFINSLSFGILQATRTRISKTEYISCPSCGRTLFDLQETTAKIRNKTSHLKGVKIGIMGCIVNGPGEMADADYGYVGSGPGKIHLYKEKTIVRKNVPEEEAVDALIDLIKDNGDWVEMTV